MTTLLANVSCVAIDGRAIVISGEPGSGKSSLALALIDRGAQLIGDDGVALIRQGEDILASPPPNISGLIEIRNIGLVPLPAISAPVSLCLDLTAQAPRMPEEIGFMALCDLPIPRLALYPDSASLPLRAEWALRLHGKR